MSLTKVSYSMIEAAPINVADYGAVGDGVANDTASLIAAEAAAYAAGMVLYVPAGTYNFNGAWTVRVNLYGYGAKIQETATTYSANVTAVIIVGAGGIVIQGIAVDGNLYRTGFSSDGFDGFTLRDCVAKRCINGGYMNYYGDNILLDRCYAEDIRYQPANAPSDGFIFVGCTRSTWRNCEANNFRRIGFVSEGDATNKSDEILALRCIAHNANNCDDSATEYNTAFWAENTNSIDWVDCVGYDIAGNPGQASGRVRGMVGFATGNNKVGTANLIRCRIYGGNGYMPIGISIEGTSNYATVNITDCYVEKARSALSTLCGFKSLNIARFNMNNIVNTGASNGGILIDANSGVALLDTLTIDNVVHQNCTFNSGAGTINFFSAPLNCQYTLLNCKNLTHVTRTYMASTFVGSCSVACGSNIAGIGSFLALNTTFSNCILTSRTNTNNDLIISTSGLPSQGILRINDSDVAGFSPGWVHPIGGADIYIYSDNSRFDSFCFSIDVTGDFQTIFRNCNIYEVPATYGFVYANFSSPTSQILIVQNCYFQANNVANTPLRKWVTNPTVSIIQNNAYRQITSLYDFTGGVTQANNVAIP